jgi:hypothetical protein|tara:strand:- start:693 stop:905 length:213 start_codon:yes stop_codon:yes gene_type:complete
VLLVRGLVPVPESPQAMSGKKVTTGQLVHALHALTLRHCLLGFVQLEFITMGTRHVETKPALAGRRRRCG